MFNGYNQPPYESDQGRVNALKKSGSIPSWAYGEHLYNTDVQQQAPGVSSWAPKPPYVSVGNGCACAECQQGSWYHKEQNEVITSPSGQEIMVLGQNGASCGYPTESPYGRPEAYARPAPPMAKTFPSCSYSSPGNQSYAPKTAAVKLPSNPKYPNYDRNADYRMFGASNYVRKPPEQRQAPYWEGSSAPFYPSDVSRMQQYQYQQSCRFPPCNPPYFFQGSPSVQQYQYPQQNSSQAYYNKVPAQSRPIEPPPPQPALPYMKQDNNAIASKISPLRLMRKKKLLGHMGQVSPPRATNLPMENAPALDVRRFLATWADEDEETQPVPQMVVLDCQDINPEQAELLRWYEANAVRDGPDPGIPPVVQQQLQQQQQVTQMQQISQRQLQTPLQQPTQQLLQPPPPLPFEPPPPLPPVDSRVEPEPNAEVPNYIEKPNIVEEAKVPEPIPQAEEPPPHPFPHDPDLEPTLVSNSPINVKESAVDSSDFPVTRPVVKERENVESSSDSPSPSDSSDSLPLLFDLPTSEYRKNKFLDYNQPIVPIIPVTNELMTATTQSIVTSQTLVDNEKLDIPKKVPKKRPRKPTIKFSIQKSHDLKISLRVMNETERSIVQEEKGVKASGEAGSSDRELITLSVEGVQGEVVQESAGSTTKRAKRMKRRYYQSQSYSVSTEGAVSENTPDGFQVQESKDSTKIKLTFKRRRSEAISEMENVEETVVKRKKKKKLKSSVPDCGNVDSSDGHALSADTTTDCNGLPPVHPHEMWVKSFDSLDQGKTNCGESLRTEEDILALASDNLSHSVPVTTSPSVNVRVDSASGEASPLTKSPCCDFDDSLKSKTLNNGEISCNISCLDEDNSPKITSSGKTDSPHGSNDSVERELQAIWDGSINKTDQPSAEEATWELRSSVPNKLQMDVDTFEEGHCTEKSRQTTTIRSASPIYPEKNLNETNLSWRCGVINFCRSRSVVEFAEDMDKPYDLRRGSKSEDIDTVPFIDDKKPCPYDPVEDIDTSPFIDDKKPCPYDPVEEILPMISNSPKEFCESQTILPNPDVQSASQLVSGTSENINETEENDYNARDVNSSDSDQFVQMSQVTCLASPDKKNCVPREPPSSSQSYSSPDKSPHYTFQGLEELKPVINSVSGNMVPSYTASPSAISYADDLENFNVHCEVPKTPEFIAAENCVKSPGPSKNILSHFESDEDDSEELLKTPKTPELLESVESPPLLGNTTHNELKLSGRNEFEIVLDPRRESYEMESTMDNLKIKSNDAKAEPTRIVSVSTADPDSVCSVSFEDNNSELNSNNCDTASSDRFCDEAEEKEEHSNSLSHENDFFSGKTSENDDSLDSDNELITSNQSISPVQGIAVGLSEIHGEEINCVDRQRWLEQERQESIISSISEGSQNTDILATQKCIEIGGQTLNEDSVMCSFEQSNPLRVPEQIIHRLETEACQNCQIGLEEDRSPPQIEGQITTGDRLELKSNVNQNGQMDFEKERSPITEDPAPIKDIFIDVVQEMELSLKSDAGETIGIELHKENSIGINYTVSDEDNGSEIESSSLDQKIPSIVSELKARELKTDVGHNLHMLLEKKCSATKESWPPNEKNVGDVVTHVSEHMELRVDGLESDASQVLELEKEPRPRLHDPFSNERNYENIVRGSLESKSLSRVMELSGLDSDSDSDHLSGHSSPSSRVELKSCKLESDAGHSCGMELVKEPSPGINDPVGDENISMDFVEQKCCHVSELRAQEIESDTCQSINMNLKKECGNVKVIWTANEENISDDPEPINSDDVQGVEIERELSPKIYDPISIKNNDSDFVMGYLKHRSSLVLDLEAHEVKPDAGENLNVGHEEKHIATITDSVSQETRVMDSTTVSKEHNNTSKALVPRGDCLKSDTDWHCCVELEKDPSIGLEVRAPKEDSNCDMVVHSDCNSSPLRDAELGIPSLKSKVNQSCKMELENEHAKDPRSSISIQPLSLVDCYGSDDNYSCGNESLTSPMNNSSYTPDRHLLDDHVSRDGEQPKTIEETFEFQEKPKEDQTSIGGGDILLNIEESSFGDNVPECGQDQLETVLSIEHNTFACDTVSEEIHTIQNKCTKVVGDLLQGQDNGSKLLPDVKVTNANVEENSCSSWPESLETSKCSVKGSDYEKDGVHIDKYRQPLEVDNGKTLREDCTSRKAVTCPSITYTEVTFSKSYIYPKNVGCPQEELPCLTDIMGGSLEASTHKLSTFCDKTNTPRGPRTPEGSPAPESQNSLSSQRTPTYQDELLRNTPVNYFSLSRSPKSLVSSVEEGEIIDDEETENEHFESRFGLTKDDEKEPSDTESTGFEPGNTYEDSRDAQEISVGDNGSDMSIELESDENANIIVLGPIDSTEDSNGANGGANAMNEVNAQISSQDNNIGIYISDRLSRDVERVEVSAVENPGQTCSGPLDCSTQVSRTTAEVNIENCKSNLRDGEVKVMESKNIKTMTGMVPLDKPEGFENKDAVTAENVEVPDIEERPEGLIISGWEGLQVLEEGEIVDDDSDEYIIVTDCKEFGEAEVILIEPSDEDDDEVFVVESEDTVDVANIPLPPGRAPKENCFDLRKWVTWQLKGSKEAFLSFRPPLCDSPFSVDNMDSFRNPSPPHSDDSGPPGTPGSPRTEDDSLKAQEDIDLSEYADGLENGKDTVGQSVIETLGVSVGSVDADEVPNDVEFQDVLANCLENAKRFFDRGPFTSENTEKQKDVLLSSFGMQSDGELSVETSSSNASPGYVRSSAVWAPEILPVDNWPYLEEEVPLSPSNKSVDDLQSEDIISNADIIVTERSEQELLPRFLCTDRSREMLKSFMNNELRATGNAESHWKRRKTIDSEAIALRKKRLPKLSLTDESSSEDQGTSINMLKCRLSLERLNIAVSKKLSPLGGDSSPEETTSSSVNYQSYNSFQWQPKVHLNRITKTLAKKLVSSDEEPLMRAADLENKMTSSLIDIPLASDPAAESSEETAVHPRKSPRGKTNVYRRHRDSSSSYSNHNTTSSDGQISRAYNLSKRIKCSTYVSLGCDFLKQKMCSEAEKTTLRTLKSPTNSIDTDVVRESHSNSNETVITLSPEKEMDVLKEEKLRKIQQEINKKKDLKRNGSKVLDKPSKKSCSSISVCDENLVNDRCENIKDHDKSNKRSSGDSSSLKKGSRRHSGHHKNRDEEAKKKCSSRKKSPTNMEMNVPVKKKKTTETDIVIECNSSQSNELKMTPDLKDEDKIKIKNSSKGNHRHSSHRKRQSAVHIDIGEIAIENECPVIAVASQSISTQVLPKKLINSVVESSSAMSSEPITIPSLREDEMKVTAASKSSRRQSVQLRSRDVVDVAATSVATKNECPDNVVAKPSKKLKHTIVESNSSESHEAIDILSLRDEEIKVKAISKVTRRQSVHRRSRGVEVSLMENSTKNESEVIAVESNKISMHVSPRKIPGVESCSSEPSKPTEIFPVGEVDTKAMKTNKGGRRRSTYHRTQVDSTIVEGSTRNNRPTPVNTVSNQSLKTLTLTNNCSDVADNCVSSQPSESNKTSLDERIEGISPSYEEQLPVTPYSDNQSACGSEDAGRFEDSKIQTKCPISENNESPLEKEKECLLSSWSCGVCGFSDESLREQHITEHAFHCQSCYLAFLSEACFIDHLNTSHQDIKKLHHCLLCELSFSTENDYRDHLKSREHLHLETVEKSTIQTLFQLLTGQPCPALGSGLPKQEWLPNQAGTVHFYHQATPLSLAVQYWRLKNGKPAVKP